MSYPDELLGSGERVVIHRHPHWKTLVLPVMSFVFVGGVSSVVLNWFSAPWWLVLAFVGFDLLIGGVSWLRWHTTHFVITTSRVLTQSGVLSTSGAAIPINRVVSVQIRRSLVDRVLGSGTLIVESASDERLLFNNIPNITEAYALLYSGVYQEPEIAAGEYRRGKK